MKLNGTVKGKVDLTASITDKLINLSHLVGKAGPRTADSLQRKIVFKP